MPASDEIRGLVCGYSARHRAEKILVMLQAFVDDSTGQTGDRSLFLAAYVNTADKWAEFSDEWEAALLAPPTIAYFKMAEAQSLRGEFYGWTEANRDKKVALLAATIRRHDPWSVECSVSTEAYNRVIGPVSPYGLGKPYFACFYGVIISLARYHRAMGATVPVDFVFDEQGGLGADTALWYEWTKSIQPREWKNLLGSSPVFRDDKKVLPLQAADMLAWHVRREAETGPTSVNTRVIDTLRGDRRHAVTRIDERRLRSMAKGMRRIPHAADSRPQNVWRKVKQEAVKRMDAGDGPPPVREDDYLGALVFWTRRLWRRLTGQI